MGPIALFDKSFIQSLTVDESVWFDRFFLPVVCPIFYVETLAGLAKSPKGSRSAESLVRIVAQKFPEMSGSPCANHHSLGVANILGTDVSMNGRIPRTGGRYVRGGGRFGVVFDQSDEEAAFHRWQREEFQEVERLFAAQWRAALHAADLDELAKTLRRLGVDGRTCKSLDDAKRIAQSVVSATDKPYERLGMAVKFFNIPQRMHDQVISRWKSQGQPPLEAYAPYAAFVLTVEIFFHLAIAANLISAVRKSNRMDIAYLFYLPFCNMFISNDRLHERITGPFLRGDQEFVRGDDLKADLARLNEHYLRLPDAERKTGIMKFAHRPPIDGGFLVTELWKRHLRPQALEDKDSAAALDPEKSKKLVEELKAFTKGANLAPGEIPKDKADIQTMSIERSVRKKKGSWWQVPEDLSDGAGENRQRS